MVLMSVDLPRPVWPALCQNNSPHMMSVYAMPGRTDADDVELEPALHELLLNLLGDAVETDIALRVDGRLLGSVRGHCGRWGLGGGSACEVGGGTVERWRRVAGEGVNKKRAGAVVDFLDELLARKGAATEAKAR
jgi:hypothetical protein